MISRRDFLKLSGAGILSLYAASHGKFIPRAKAAIPGGTLDPLGIDKFVTPLLIPPAMPKAGTLKQRGKTVDYYEVSMRQFQEQILPDGLPPTTVWGYGALKSAKKNGLLLHHAPSLTIEARVDTPVQIKWVNELQDSDGNYLPHLLPVDPTLHWANPPGGLAGRDARPTFAATPDPYTGPVPMVTHVHGAVGVGDESDGHAEAWFLPTANNIPAGYATEGTWYNYFKNKAKAGYGATWGPGFATFQYPNHNRASTIWYHDHTLGMTRLNVYAGPAGFYIIRGGQSDIVRDSRTGMKAVLPGPAPVEDSNPYGTFYEIPIAIQDRSFNADGSLFYPDTRAFFDGFAGPFIPGTEISPIWNPEFFGNTIMVNGNTWPYLNVEQRRYRFRFLNGCDSRFLVLKFDHPNVDVWQIGNEGGFLAAPVHINDLDIGGVGGVLLMTLAERADVIVDFTDVPLGTDVTLLNVGLDEPFGGFPIDSPADLATTGQVMQFRVGPRVGTDLSTPPQYLQLPPIAPLPGETFTRPLAMLEKGATIPEIGFDGPIEAMLGTVDGDGMPMHKMWGDPITENPMVGDTEVWEFYNFTADAHPMHVHEVAFEVVNRQALETDADGMALMPSALVGDPRDPEPWENGFKDTVIAYPGEVTRIRAKFDNPGTFVWHCHIVSHEDNEMMRPYRIGPADPAAPNGGM